MLERQGKGGGRGRDRQTKIVCNVAVLRSKFQFHFRTVSCHPSSSTSNYQLVINPVPLKNYQLVNLPVPFKNYQMVTLPVPLQNYQLSPFQLHFKIINWHPSSSSSKLSTVTLPVSLQTINCHPSSSTSQLPTVTLLVPLQNYQLSPFQVHFRTVHCTKLMVGPKLRQKQ